LRRYVVTNEKRIEYVLSSLPPHRFGVGGIPIGVLVFGDTKTTTEACIDNEEWNATERCRE
jgi:hypothetical protein